MAATISEARVPARAHTAATLSSVDACVREEGMNDGKSSGVIPQFLHCGANKEKSNNRKDWMSSSVCEIIRWKCLLAAVYTPMNFSRGLCEKDTQKSRARFG